MPYYSHTNRQQQIGQGEKPGRRKFCVDSEDLFCIAQQHFLPHKYATYNPERTREPTSPPNKKPRTTRRSSYLRENSKLTGVLSSEGPQPPWTFLLYSDTTRAGKFFAKNSETTRAQHLRHFGASTKTSCVIFPGVGRPPQVLTKAIDNRTSRSKPSTVTR